MAADKAAKESAAKEREANAEKAEKAQPDKKEKGEQTEKGKEKRRRDSSPSGDEGPRKHPLAPVLAVPRLIPGSDLS